VIYKSPFIFVPLPIVARNAGYRSLSTIVMIDKEIDSRIRGYLFCHERTNW